MRKTITLLLFVTLGFGDDVPTLDEPATFSVGVAYSQVGGTGITYRQYNTHGYTQFTGVVAYNETLYASLGASVGEYLYKRNVGPNSITLPFAIKYHYGASANTSDYSSSASGGAGIGVEFGYPQSKGYVLELVVDYIGGYDSVSKWVLQNSFSVGLNFNF